MKKKYSVKAIRVVFAILVFSLVFNIIYVGISGKDLISGDDVATFAKNRGISQQIDYAARGQIYSSDGEVIATNVKKYKLILILSTTRTTTGNKKAYVTDVRTTAQKLAPIIGMNEATLYNKIQTARDAGRYQIELGKYGSGLTAATKKKIEDLNLTGLEFIESNSRYYPMGDFASYIIGYAKSYEENSVQKIVGEMGLELKYEKDLSGTNGYRVYQVDAKGYMLSNQYIKQKDPVDGKNIYLTIDSGLQRDLDYMMSQAVTEVKADYASCAVMEVKTGKILAVSSYPSFNPNKLDITNYSNYFAESTFECGSVFKPFIYAQAIEEGKYSHSATFNSGSFNVTANGKIIATIHDWNNGQGWGQITYDEGLTRSSNVAICNLLTNGYITKETLIKNLSKLGFFENTDLDGLAASSGIAAYKKDNSLLTYLTTGFGQASTTTALQLLQAYSVFGNDGKIVKPYIVDRIVDPDTKKVTYSGKTQKSEQIFSSETINQVKALMLNVVDDSVGTGSKYKLDNGVEMFGKTGTGQISGGASGYLNDVYMHSFAGLAPYDNPQVEIFITIRSGDNYSPMVNIIKKTMTSALQIVDSRSKTKSYTSTKSATVSLDSYINQSVAFVQTKLTSLGLIAVVIGDGKSVIKQYPTYNQKVTAGQKVFIVSDGTRITLPDFTGWSRKDVSSYCNLAGLNVVFNGSTGTVNAQSIAPGQEVKAGVSLTVNIR